MDKSEVIFYDFKSGQKVSSEFIIRAPDDENNPAKKHIDFLTQFGRQIKNIIYSVEFIGDPIPLSGSSCVIDRDEIYLINCLTKDLMTDAVIIIEPEEDDDTGE